MANCTCKKCGKSMDEINFYTHKDGSKTDLCKKCLTMHIDNFDESTYLWLLEKMDVPYVPTEWNVLRDKAFAKDPKKMNGMSVFGKYLSKMKLKQWKEYSWADTEMLQARSRGEFSSGPLTEEERAFEAQLKEQLNEGLISEAEYKTLAPVEVQYENLDTGDVVGDNNYFKEENYIPEAELDAVSDQLTAEDKILLAMKWGRLYKPSEWLELERKYAEMQNSFDIQDSDSDSTLILICKTYLKMNQAIDCGDMDGYQKLSKVYDSLRKSAKFTAAQNKEQKAQDFDSVGNLVAFCEKEGGKIPRYDLSINLDKADEAIADIKKYVKNLIYNDTNLAQQIETYLKQLSINQQMKDDRERAKEQGLDYVPIEDEDLLEFNQSIAEQKEEDEYELRKFD